MSVELSERVENQVLDDGSHDKFKHLVLEGWTFKDGEFAPVQSVVDGTVFGTPVVALCGKVWVPGDNPDKYQLCPTCAEIAKEQGWTIPNS